MPPSEFITNGDEVKDLEAVLTIREAGWRREDWITILLLEAQAMMHEVVAEILLRRQMEGLDQ